MTLIACKYYKENVAHKHNKTDAEESHALNSIIDYCERMLIQQDDMMQNLDKIIKKPEPLRAPKSTREDGH